MSNKNPFDEFPVTCASTLGRFEYKNDCCCNHCHSARHRYWLEWIYNIKRDIETSKCPQGIIEHIAKHFVEDMQKHIAEENETGAAKWEDWFSSAYNLIAIFEAFKYGRVLDPLEWRQSMIDRLRIKYRRNPDTHTAPPSVETITISFETDSEAIDFLTGFGIRVHRGVVYLDAEKEYSKNIHAAIMHLVEEWDYEIMHEAKT